MERIERRRRRTPLKDEVSLDPEVGRRLTERAQNKVTNNFLDAAILAADRVGEDNRGRNGLVGFFSRVARTEPKVFFWLLARLAVAQSKNKGDEQLPLDKPYETMEEALEACRLLGMTPASFRELADDWEEHERAARSANADPVKIAVQRVRRLPDRAP